MSGYELIPVMQALRADNKVEARQLLQPILEANPTADAWLLAARAQEDGQTDAIKGYLQRALALDPDHSESLQMVEQLGITLDTGAIDPVAQDVRHLQQAHHPRMQMLTKRMIRSAALIHLVVARHQHPRLNHP